MIVLADDLRRSIVLRYIGQKNINQEKPKPDGSSTGKKYIPINTTNQQ